MFCHPEPSESEREGSHLRIATCKIIIVRSLALLGMTSIRGDVAKTVVLRSRLRAVAENKFFLIKERRRNCVAAAEENTGRVS